jgi:hypothetical protein
MACSVMPALVAGTSFLICFKQDVDGRVKPGHDEHSFIVLIRAFTISGR